MNKAILIYEAGINHSGSLETAYKLIDEAVECGCNYIKWQKRTVEDVYSKEELDKPRESPFGKTNREQKEGIEFSIMEYFEIYNYCKHKGIGFMYSPWDLKSLELMNKNFEVDYIKVASASLTDLELLQAIKDTGRKTIMSTGMSTFAEIDRAANILRPVYILSCSSTYPTDIKELNFGKMKALQEEYITANIGFSSHYPNHYACIYSIANGATMVEFHGTLDKTMSGSDQKASLEKADIMRISKFRDFCSELDREVFWEPFKNEIPIADKLRKK